MAYKQQKFEILTVLEAAKAKIKVLTDLESGGGSLSGSTMSHYTLSPYVGRGHSTLWGLFYKKGHKSCS